jgi:hypothetical protein
MLDLRNLAHHFLIASFYPMRLFTLVRSFFRIAKFALASITVCLFFQVHSTSFAEEPLEAFISQLKERGYFDVAYDYLERAEKSGSITLELKGRLDFEKADVLIDGLSQVRDPNQRQQNLDQSQVLLENFISKNELHPYASIAKKTLGDLLQKRGELALDKSKSDKTSEADANKLVLQARDYYQKAESVLISSRDSLKETLGRIDPKATDSVRKKMLEKYRIDYLRVRLLLGALPEKLADTYPNDSKEYKENLEKAIALYDDYAKDYHEKLIGYRARFYQARCYYKLGNSKEATTFITDVLDQPEIPEFRDLKRESCLLGVKIWFNEKPPQYLLAIKNMQPLLESISPNDARTETWLELELELARAYYNYHLQVESKSDASAEDKAQSSKAKSLAVDHLRSVARFSSDLKSQAQQLLVEWDVRRKVDDPQQEKPPESFVEARDRANIILTDFSNDQSTLASLEELLKTTPEAEKPALQEQIDATKAAIKSGPGRALELLRSALTKVEPDTSRQDMESLLYNLTFCYFAMEKYQESLVVSEHLLVLSPNSTPAKGASQFAIQSLLQMAAQDDGGAQFEKEELKKLCEQVLRTWPGDPVTVKAAAAMIQLALRANDVQAAEEYMQRVPDGTEGKATLQLNVGFLLWATLRRGEYELSQDKTIEPDARVAKEKEFQDLRVRAQGYLAQALPELKSGDVDGTAARSALALAQLYVDFNKMDEAIAVLENPVYGPLTLIKNDHPASNPTSQFHADVYQAALSAYVGTLGSSDDPAATTQKARTAMQDLKKSLADVPDGDKRLISIYLRMASKVKTKMESLDSATDRAAFRTGLIAFLDAVQKEANELSVLVWVAGTYTSFGEEADEKQDAAKSKEYYEKAASVYEKILQLDEQDPNTLTDGEAFEMTRRYARSMGKSGNHEKAVELYTEILTKQSAIIDIQYDAALALEDWGKATKDVNAFARAMAGTASVVDEKTGRPTNAIWGWGKLGNVVIKYEQYRDRFIDVRYHLAYSRYEYAKLRDTPEKYMAQAKNDILATLRADPKLGGAEARAKFDALLKVIQKELGESPTGLPN